LIPENLGNRELDDVLAAAKNWDSTAQSVIVAEGLTQYLPPAAVRDLFVQCSATSGAGSRIAFTYVGTGVNGQADIGRWTWLTLWILKASGEPWLFSVWPGELVEFLAEAGWTLAPQLVDGTGRCGVEYHAVALK
jgi:O-methyltransferase involved in polyketide biosynthesis